jgi:hypothetical protein
MLGDLAIGIFLEITNFLNKLLGRVEHVAGTDGLEASVEVGSINDREIPSEAAQNAVAANVEHALVVPGEFEGS